MEPNMNYEKEISLTEIFKVLLKNLKLLIICGVVIGVLGGGFALVKGFMALSDDEKIQEEVLKSENLQKSYELKKQTLEDSTDNIKSEIVKQKEYNENALLMKIDPFNKNEINLTYYVEYDYQIMPDMVYQNIDKSSRIISAYMSFINRGYLNNYIHLNLVSNGTTMEDLKDVVEVTTENNLILISVFHPDGTINKEIIELIKKFFDSESKFISETIDIHKLNILSESNDVIIDLDLDSLQKTNLDKITALSTVLSQKYDELYRLKEPVNTVPTIISIIKNIIVFGIAGFVGGAMMAAAHVLLKRAFKKTINTEEYLVMTSGLNVIGKIPTIK